MFLSHNKLQNITQDVFGNMPHLQVLDLSYNHIMEMEFDCFKNTKKIQVIVESNHKYFIKKINNIISQSFRCFMYLTICCMIYHQKSSVHYNY